MLREFPTVRQENPSNCGPASVQAVLRFYGLDVPQAEIALACKTSAASGTDPADLVAYLQKQGCTVKAGPLTLSALLTYLGQDVPVIVDLQAWAKNPTDYAKTTKEGHYLVAIGFEGGQVVFEDPALDAVQGRAALPLEQLAARWHDSDSQGQTTEFWGVAVLGRQKPQKQYRWWLAGGIFALLMWHLKNKGATQTGENL